MAEYSFSTNAAQVKEIHRRIEEKLKREITASLSQAGVIGLFEARANAGFKNRSGDTQRSVEYKFLSPTKLRFGSRYKVAAWMERGTAAHPIPLTPKSPDDPLIFFWERTGKWHRFLQVNHPGTKPTRFLEKSAAKMKLFLRLRLVQAAKRALQR